MTQWFDFCPNCGSRTIPCKCSAAVPCRWCLRSHHPKVECKARTAGLKKIMESATKKMNENAARQIDRDALIEILRGPYATYEEQADAVMALLGGEV